MREIVLKLAAALFLSWLAVTAVRVDIAAQNSFAENTRNGSLQAASERGNPP